jgi:hypothetical protein
MPGSKPVKNTQPHLYNLQVENPQTNRQESSRSSNQPAIAYRQTELVHSVQYGYAHLADQRAVQAGPISTGTGKRMNGCVDCESCVARGVCTLILNPMPPHGTDYDLAGVMPRDFKSGLHFDFPRGFRRR